MQSSSQELVNFIKAFNISPHERLGMEIQEECQNSIAGESLELRANLGQIVKESVTQKNLNNALQVLPFCEKDALPHPVNWGEIKPQGLLGVAWG